MEKKNKGVLVHLKPVVAAERSPGQGITELHVKKDKKDKKDKIKIAIVIVVVLLLVGYAQVKLGIRTHMDVINIHNDEGANNNQYESFQGNYLRYGKDGMALVDAKMNEIWNVAYQISNPMVVKQGNALAVADRNGNQIIVVDADGIKGEIYTNLPIEKISVSNQGLVLAQVKDDTSSQILCYDNIGNIILEHQVSVNTMGYPLDAAISFDGTRMMVTYLNYSEGVIESSYKCYSLDNPDATGDDRVIASGEMKGTILPTTFFAGKTSAIVVGDDRIFFVDTDKRDAEHKEVLIENEISSIAFEGDYLAVATKSNDGLNESRLLIYNKDAKLTGDVSYEGSYTNIKIVDKTILLYEGERCKIFSIKGTEIFDGEYSGEIISIFPVSIFNKYLLIGKEDIVDVRLKR